MIVLAGDIKNPTNISISRVDAEHISAYILLSPKLKVTALNPWMGFEMNPVQVIYYK